MAIRVFFRKGLLFWIELNIMETWSNRIKSIYNVDAFYPAGKSAIRLIWNELEIMEQIFKGRHLRTSF